MIVRLLLLCMLMHVGMDYCAGSGRKLSEKLFQAVFNNDINEVKYLVEEGANVNAKNANGTTLIHFAASCGFLDVVEYLVEKGANVNAKDKNDTALMHFAALANKDIIDYLVTKGVNINAMDKQGNTPLHKVLYACNCDASRSSDWFEKATCDYLIKKAQYLVKKGADCDAPNTDGKTPLDIAKEKGVYKKIQKEIDKRPRKAF